jgi:hypothetical protein
MKPAPPPPRLEWLALSLAVALAVALLALSAALTGPGERPFADPSPAKAVDGGCYCLPAAAALPIRFTSA